MPARPLAHRWIALVVAGVLAPVVLLAGGGQSQQPQQPRVKALLISSGAFHDYLYQSRVFIESVGKALPVDWTVALQGSATGTRTRYPVYDRDDWARGFDIVIHNECSADVDDPAFISRITSAHRAGGVPAMVIHCAMHSYRAAAVDDWREFLGVTTRRHTPQFRIPVEWSGDPIVAGLEPGWVTPMDELYVIERVWPGVRSLATAVDPADQQAYPVAWTHENGGVRVFGTTLGHGIATWDDPVYQELLTRGFRWAIGQTPSVAD